MPRKYFDCHNREIKEGMFVYIRGMRKPLLVEKCGEGKLGILASNPDFLKHHPYAEPEYYLLSMFPKPYICICDCNECDDGGAP